MTKKEKGALVDMYRKAAFNYAMARDILQSTDENDSNYNNVYAGWCEAQGVERALWDVLYYVCHMAEADIYLITEQAETDAMKEL